MARIDWDEVASDYRDARGLDMDGLDGWRQALLPLMPPRGTRLLDLGCGAGQFLVPFREWFGLRLVGIEPSAGMLGEAAKAARVPEVALIRGTAGRIPARRHSFGAAWLSTVIHHFADLGAAAHDLRRVVVDGGPILIRSAFPGRLDRLTSVKFFPEVADVIATYPSVDSTVAAFEAAGFAFERLEAVPQVSAPNLDAYRMRAVLRADTTLRLMSDEAFTRGMARLDEAIAAGDAGEPVVDALDLLVLR